ncbi:hypothetical protein BC629DRAFT_1274380, partial [Irpex lacteus]
LAYVEWFTPFQRTPQPHHLLYRIQRSLGVNGRPLGSGIPLPSVRRTIQLFPSFGPIAPRVYSSDNV